MRLCLRSVVYILWVTTISFLVLIAKSKLVMVCYFLATGKVRIRPHIFGCLPNKPHLHNETTNLVRNILLNNRFVRDKWVLFGCDWLMLCYISWNTLRFIIVSSKEIMVLEKIFANSELNFSILLSMIVIFSWP